jgi:hypothetical protein
LPRHGQLHFVLRVLDEVPGHVDGGEQDLACNSNGGWYIVLTDDPGSRPQVSPSPRLIMIGVVTGKSVSPTSFLLM